MDESQITSCRICGGKIAIEASACPHCGAPKTSSTAASPKMLDSKSRGTYIVVIGGISTLGGIVSDVLQPLAPLLPYSLFCTLAAAVILSCFWSRLGNLGRKLTGLFWCWSIVCTLFISMRFLPFVGEDANEHGVIANIIPGIKSFQDRLIQLETGLAEHRKEDAASSEKTNAYLRKILEHQQNQDVRLLAHTKLQEQSIARNVKENRSVAMKPSDPDEPDVPTPPSDIEGQTQLARASLLESQAWVDSAAGNEQAAWDGWRQSLKIRRAHINENLEDLNALRVFTVSLRLNAWYEWTFGQRDVAFALLQECYGEANQLYLASKTPSAMAEFVLICSLYGSILKSDGDNDQARLMFEESLELRQYLAAVEPDLAGGIMSFLFDLASLADLEYWEDNFERAMELYLEELAMVRELNQQAGVGIQVALNNEDEYVVMEVFEGMPALIAGIRANDIIAQVDGVPTVGWDFYETMGRILGEQGTEVSLGLLREGVENLFQITIVRDMFNIESLLAYQSQSLSRLGEIDMILINDEELSYEANEEQVETAAERFLEAARIRKDLLTPEDVTGRADLAIDLYWWTNSLGWGTSRCKLFYEVIAICDELKGTIVEQRVVYNKAWSIYWTGYPCTNGPQENMDRKQLAMDTLREAAESTSSDSQATWAELLAMKTEVIRQEFDFANMSERKADQYYIDLLDTLPEIGEQDPALLDKIDQIQLELNAIRPPENGIPRSVLVGVLLVGFVVLVVFIILGVAFYKLKK